MYLHPAESEMVILLSGLVGGVSKEKNHIVLFWMNHPEHGAEKRDIPRAEAAAFLDP